MGEDTRSIPAENVLGGGYTGEHMLKTSYIRKSALSRTRDLYILLYAKYF